MKLFEALAVICCKNIEIVHTELKGSALDNDLRVEEVSRETITSEDVWRFKYDDARGMMRVVSIKPVDADTIEICYTSEEEWA